MDERRRGTARVGALLLVAVLVASRAQALQQDPKQRTIRIPRSYQSPDQHQGPRDAAARRHQYGRSWQEVAGELPARAWRGLEELLHGGATRIAGDSNSHSSSSSSSSSSSRSHSSSSHSSSSHSSSSLASSWVRRTLAGTGPAAGGHEGKAPQHKHGAHEKAGARACHPDCTKRGNCNVAEGRCECPFGLQGEACEQLAFPACRPVNMTLAQAEAAGVDLQITCAEHMRLSCECYRQCWSHYCPEDDACRLFRDPVQRCYDYNDLPPGQQVSVYPDPAWTNVTYRADIFEMYPPVNVTRFRAIEGMPTITSQQPSKCPASCNGKGMCVREELEIEGRQVEVFRCMCIQGYMGDACETKTNDWCLVGCSGRGECVRGFCHCRPPFYGLGCLKGAPKPLQKHPPGGHEHGQQRFPARSRLKIYMYDLPWQVAFQEGYFPEWFGHDSIYVAFWQFANRLAEDKEVLTDDPSEANMFFMNSLSYYYSSNIGSPTLHMQDVIGHIRERFPYWNASGGIDHFYFAVNDRGACILNSTLPDVWAPIKLVHFGAFSKNVQRDLGIDHIGEQVGHHGYGCFQPEKDIVVAPYHDQLAEIAHNTYNSEEGRLAFDAERPILLAFAGGIRYNEPEYSGGVRQKLYTIFKNNRTHMPKEGDEQRYPAKKNEIIIHDGWTPWHDEWMRQAKFCLAPYGHGWGIRLSQVMAMGCVPVIIQDHIFQPFEDLLPYHEFSIRLSSADAWGIKQHLMAVSPAEWKRLHEGLKKWWQPFIWEEKAGGSAYKATIASLRKRLSSRLAGLASAKKRSV